MPIILQTDPVPIAEVTVASITTLVAIFFIKFHLGRKAASVPGARRAKRRSRA